ncbi:AAA family ATPase [Burkholderia gladioli]|uniref:AAA family ATPase n=1 Tax=Burkholderia gladioli TaxID=28095 RepID=UPI0016422DA1|nr:AAA family ATPase [Burkholderia gladioli]
MSNLSAIGLCGPHRTGKTTLARAYAEKHGIPFVVTSTSAVFAKHGLDPAAPMDFKTRIDIQLKILDAAEEAWQKHGESAWITDRTPLDMLMYTLGDIQGGTEVDPTEVNGYASRCFDVTERLFGMLIAVQPGIPLVHEPGKAALNLPYLDHLNTVMIGLLFSESNRTPHSVIPRHVLDIEHRIRHIEQ